MSYNGVPGSQLLPENQSMEYADFLKSQVEQLQEENAKLRNSLESAGFEDRGGELWAPPVNKDPAILKVLTLQDRWIELKRVLTEHRSNICLSWNIDDTLELMKELELAEVAGYEPARGLRSEDAKTIPLAICKAVLKAVSDG